ncbi:MAG: B12-binding domain-containing radical SAM protein [Deltaproteobacteria bacterium]|nr:MAG: B12-binding domain-containing radical SAM protein [Deltaproteobacteria bacterium]
MPKDAPHVLLINPWIDDFAAFDFWAKPIGLLTLASILRMHGYGVSYIDCLDRFHPELTYPGRVGRFGKGHYLKRRLPKPEKLYDIPRHYSRYGIPERLLRKAINSNPRPAAVLVTSMMTYWYPGVFALIQVVREMLPEVPVVLGGIYATLCHEHAVRHAGADMVLSGQSETSLLELLGQFTGYTNSCRFTPDELDTYPYPAFDLQSSIAYVPILTGQGCPFRCAYCASGFLNPGFRRRSPEHVVEEIAFWHKKYAVLDFVFYDDALLIDADRHIIPILEGVVARGLQVRFHTPNALHIRPLSKEVAKMLFRAGFKTIRLGLETASFDGREAIDTKVGPDEFEQALHHLKKAGFKGEAIGAYLLYGLPGQDLVELETSIKMVKTFGVSPILAQYSPIPHTALWPAAVRASRYDLTSDPIFQNNSIFPCQKASFSWEKISYFKKLARE